MLTVGIARAKCERCGLIGIQANSGRDSRTHRVGQSKLTDSPPAMVIAAANIDGWIELRMN